MWRTMLVDGLRAGKGKVRPGARRPPGLGPERGGPLARGCLLLPPAELASALAHRRDLRFDLRLDGGLQRFE